MKTIWKYPVAHGEKITMPSGAQIMSMQIQGERPQMWALVDPSERMEECAIAIYGTGFDMPDDPGQYLGTFQTIGGLFVFHVFKVAASAPK